MKKETIKFLIKNGFTIDEIADMETEKAENEPEKKPEPKPESVKEEPKKESVEDMIAALRKEISDLRETTHAQNRARNVIEETPKQLTFEEDIEKMIEEVTK